MFNNIDKYKNTPIIIRWYTQESSNSYKWIHYRFFRAFKFLWFDVKRVDSNINNLPSKWKKYIIITEHQVDKVLLENYSNNRVIFDHYLTLDKYNQWNVANKNIYPFFPVQYNLARQVWRWLTIEEFYYQKNMPTIFWWCDLLPNEMVWRPYHYNNTQDVSFLGSRRQDNRLQLEKLRIYCILNWLKYHQYGKHLLLRSPFFKNDFLTPEELEQKTFNAFISPALQGNQINDWYIPCRLFINMSLSVLAVSNNPYVYYLFDDDEVIVDKNIWKMMMKAQKIIKDRKVDLYTKKAFEKVKEKHTYINRINELFAYL